VIAFLLEGDRKPRLGFAERMDWPGSTHVLRQVPSGEIVPPGTEVRIVGCDEHEVGRVADSGYRFVGGPPAGPMSGARWIDAAVARER